MLAETGSEAIVLFLAVARRGRASLPLHLPLSLSAVRQTGDACELPVGSGRFFVAEAEGREMYGRFLVDGFGRVAKIRTAAGDRVTFRGESLGSFRSLSLPVGDDSSNVLVRLTTGRGDVVFKSYKLLDPGNREPLILERLHRRGFAGIPPYLGEVAIGRGADRLVLGLAAERVDATDLFTWLTDAWREEFGLSAAPRGPGFERESIDVAGALGEATARLHAALVDRHRGSFGVETFDSTDVAAARRVALADLSTAVRVLRAAEKGNAAIAAHVAAQARTLLLVNRARIEGTLRGLDAAVGTPKSVTHGDLHLGQVLRSPQDGGLFFVDFEGEPERHGRARSAKMPPLRDVATMARSFSYVKHYAWRDLRGGDASAALQLFDAKRSREAERLTAWESAASQAFIARYMAASSLYRDWPSGEVLRALRGWMAERALYELAYELKHRPSNLLIPLEGILSLAGKADRIVAARAR